VSRTVEAGRGTEEKTPRPKVFFSCEFCYVFWGEEFCWLDVSDMPRSFLSSVGVGVLVAIDDLKMGTNLPFAGVYLI